MQSSTEQLIYRALDQTVTPASLQQLIADKLNTFSEEHHLNLDTLLSNYLKVHVMLTSQYGTIQHVSLQLFLARAPTHSSDFPGSPWEIKAVTLAHSVACTDLRVACCVEVLQCVTVPWSKEVTELVHECLPLDQVGELQSLHDLLQLKVMLQDSYGIMDFNFSDHITGQVSCHSKLSPSHNPLLSRLVALYPAHAAAGEAPDVGRYAQSECILPWPALISLFPLQVAAMYKISESKVYMHHLYNLCCQNKASKRFSISHTPTHT